MTKKIKREIKGDSSNIPSLFHLVNNFQTNDDFVLSKKFDHSGIKELDNFLNKKLKL